MADNNDYKLSMSRLFIYKMREKLEDAISLKLKDREDLFYITIGEIMFELQYTVNNFPNDWDEIDPIFSRFNPNQETK